jgi:hypothetical protein
MRRVLKWLEETHEYVQKDFDRIIPVIGDEGMGKSTLMMACAWMWRDITGREQTVEATVDRIAWNNDDFKTMLGGAPKRSCIIVHDAARVLSRKKAMHGSQIEIEEDLLDARFGNYLVLLGFQDFDLVPTMLATRRAKNMLRVPSRGVVHGYNEAQIRKRYQKDKWPDPAMKDTFPDLAGTELWEAFEEEDQARKQDRIQPDEEDGEQDLGVRELADKIREEDDIEDVVSIHGGHNKPYIDADLIEIEYMVSGNKAKKVAKLLKKEVELAP